MKISNFGLSAASAFVLALSMHSNAFAGQCDRIGSLPWSGTIGVWGEGVYPIHAQSDAIQRRDNEIARCEAVCSSKGGTLSYDLNPIQTDVDCSRNGNWSTCFASAFVRCDAQPDDPIPPATPEDIKNYKMIDDYYKGGELVTENDLKAVHKRLIGTSMRVANPSVKSSPELVIYEHGDDITVPKKIYAMGFKANLTVETTSAFLISLIDEKLLTPVKYDATKKIASFERFSGEADWPGYGIQKVCGSISEMRKAKTTDGKNILIEKFHVTDQRDECQSIADGVNYNDSMSYYVMD